MSPKVQNVDAKTGQASVTFKATDADGDRLNWMYEMFGAIEKVGELTESDKLDIGFFPKDEGLQANENVMITATVSDSQESVTETAEVRIVGGNSAPEITKITPEIQTVDTDDSSASIELLLLIPMEII